MTTVLILVWSFVVTPAQTPSGTAVTLDQAVREALDHNLNLLTERFNVSVADTAIVTAALKPNPVVTVNVFRPDRTLVDAGISQYEQVVRTDYVLERGGKRERRVDQATLAKSIAALQLLNTTRNLIDLCSALLHLRLNDRCRARTAQCPVLFRRRHPRAVRAPDQSQRVSGRRIYLALRRRCDERRAGGL